MSLEKELIKDMAGFTRNISKWVLYSFPWGKGELDGFDGPDEEQTEWLEQIDARLQTEEAGVVIRDALASGHGIGKSTRVSWLILWALSTFEDTKGIVTANTETQLKTKTWAELAKWYRLFIAKHWFVFTATSIFSADPEHEKTWRIDQIPWSERNTEAFAGMHNKGKRILLIFDEASAIPDAIWDVAEGAMTDSDTEIIWCVFGNPTQNGGRFYDCFHRFKHRWTTHCVDSRRSRFTNKELIEEWIADYGIDSDFVKVRVRGMFPNLSVRGFYSTKDLDEALRVNLRPEQYDFAPVILTLDPAWEGDDSLEIGRRQGLSFKILETIPFNDNDIQIATKLAHYEDQERADAVFIDGGYGTGIISAGRTWGRTWQIVWFAGESTDPGCLNKRAQMASEAKKWLKSGGCLHGDHELYGDMTAIETVPRTDGKLQIEDKKAIKKRLKRSTGKLDALLLSFAYPVHQDLAPRIITPSQEDWLHIQGQSHGGRAVNLE